MKVDDDDAARFEALVCPHFDALYRTALRMVRRPAEAEDMVQEACLRAYAALNPLHHKTNIRAWLFRILVNLCIDHLRTTERRARLRETKPDSVDGEPTANVFDPEEQMIAQRLGERIHKAMNDLSPELRIVVLLVLVEEMSYAEAAESLAIPIGTVRSRLNRARSHLQSALGDQFPERHTEVRLVAKGGVRLP